MNLTNLLFKIVEDKTITWIEESNEYIVLENTTADILKRLSKGVSVIEIARGLSKKLEVPLEKAKDFILDLQINIFSNKNLDHVDIINDYRAIKKPTSYEYIKYYKINNIIFKVSFLSETELSFIHPKFDHLVIENSTVFHNEFDIFIDNNFIFLYVNNIIIGSWSSKDVHFFQGKFSMELIQKIHQKREDEWIGVFHASAISNGEKSMLFLGDSGNGKSTSLALLQASGFICLADDFVPVDSKKQEVYSFPASISIKKNSLKTLIPIYPELDTSEEYHITRLNKVVRYLKPNNPNYFAHLPCNDLVFIKYVASSDLICEKISSIDAFQQLIPDSWLSPKKENAKIFLDWFNNLNCYQLTYSNNNKMIETISKIFKDEL